ncbi:hypothetical protein V6Z11_D12G098900 [Gossypium hirsutum]
MLQQFYSQLIRWAHPPPVPHQDGPPQPRKPFPSVEAFKSQEVSNSISFSVNMVESTTAKVLRNTFVHLQYKHPVWFNQDQTAYLPKSELAPENLENVGKRKSNKSKALRPQYHRTLLIACFPKYLDQIAFPSSLPGPPHIKKRRKLTWHERFLVLKEASRLYAASWKDDGTEGKSNGDKSRSTEIEPLTLDDIGEELYFVVFYLEIDALKSFMEGYQEVIQQIMEKKEFSSTAQQEGNTDKNST